MSGCGRTAQGVPGQPPHSRLRQVQELKWTEEDFADAKDGQLPMGKPADEWSFGDWEAGLKKADLVLDETFVTPNTSHQPLETRTAMAYWQNGKVYVHCSHAEHGADRSRHRALAGPNVKSSDDVVVISEYTGGGFGSKITSAISAIIPCILSKKVGAPVMMRISREEEHYIGRARPSLHGRLKVGFTKEGNITAVDMFVVCDNGPYDPQGDAMTVGPHGLADVSAAGHALARLSVLTNTPPRVSQSQPGGFQGIALMEPILSKAARKLGIDQVAIHRINAPEGKAMIGPPVRRQAAYVTSASSRKRSTAARAVRVGRAQEAQPKRSGTKVRGIGVATSCFVGGSVGFDGLFVIKPDGRLYIQIAASAIWVPNR